MLKYLTLFSILGVLYHYKSIEIVYQLLNVPRDLPREKEQNKNELDIRVYSFNAEPNNIYHLDFQIKLCIYVGDKFVQT